MYLTEVQHLLKYWFVWLMVIVVLFAILAVKELESKS
jgi:hypothetical protein